MGTQLTLLAMEVTSEEVIISSGSTLPNNYSKCFVNQTLAPPITVTLAANPPTSSHKAATSSLETRIFYRNYWVGITVVAEVNSMASGTFRLPLSRIISLTIYRSWLRWFRISRISRDWVDKDFSLAPDSTQARVDQAFRCPLPGQITISTTLSLAWIWIMISCSIVAHPAQLSKLVAACLIGMKTLIILDSRIRKDKSIVKTIWVWTDKISLLSSALVIRPLLVVFRPSSTMRNLRSLAIKVAMVPEEKTLSITWIMKPIHRRCRRESLWPQTSPTAW